MTPAPSISVILPTFQHRDTVGRAIQSVLEQTYDDFELIIIDDGSTDGTTEILKEYQSKDLRIYVHRNPQNSGCPAHVCNEAVRKHARGKYIAFQFDDDLWFEWCLERLIQNIDKIDFVFGRTVFIDDRTKEFLFMKGGTKLTPANILQDNLLANNAILMKRSIYLALGGYDENPLVKRVCDWELWIRVVHQGYKTHPIPAIVSVCFPYRPHSVGVTSTYDLVAVRRYIQKKLGLLDQ